MLNVKTQYINYLIILKMQQIGGKYDTVLKEHPSNVADAYAKISIHINISHKLDGDMNLQHLGHSFKTLK